MKQIFTALKCRAEACVNTNFKRTVHLIFISLLLMLTEVYAAGFNQNVNIDVKNVPVKDVLNQLTKQTGYNFICDAEVIKSTKMITLHASNTALIKVLNQCFASLPVDILFDNEHTVVIRHKEKTTVKEASAAIGITGKVKDAQGISLPGVSVLIKGTTTGTVTDANGGFSVRVPDTKSVLVFSFIGFITQEIAVNNQTTVNVTLVESAKSLNEVVVVGYGQQSRATVTSAITKVEGKNIANQPVSTPGEALAGLAPGVQVQSDQGAKPGAAPTIRVRGVSSLSSSNDPLYVVDGYPLETAANFNLINPNDIESLEVLKDAASAAIYGSRAANGVVLVTTKRGKAGKTVFSVSAYTGL
ncbi:MAG: SusC/RagA family TonB-linked outer membrane protein, partial [Sphingobacteriaceae bacterium]